GVNPENTLTYSAMNPAILEVLPAAERGAFRFRAEVSHRFSYPAGQVGIAFLHSARSVRPDPSDERHWFCTVTFSDCRASVRNVADQPVASRVGLSLWHVRRGHGRHQAKVGKETTFVPAWLVNPNWQPWRRLAVEVTPAGIRTHWEGQDL